MGNTNMYINGKPISYLDMIHKTLHLLSHRNGSSVFAITKFMKDYYHDRLVDVPPKRLKPFIAGALRLGLHKKRFVKIKNSYKLNKEWLQQELSSRKVLEGQKLVRQI